MDNKQFSVQVRFFGVLEMYTGTRQISIDLPTGSNLKWLLNRLEETNPPAYRDLLKQSSKGEPFLRVMLNNTLIHENDFGISLSQDDVVTLLPAISGGA